MPFESRLESIDTCERLFRDTPTRYSTDNIGLARVKEGLELVRIGPAMRPEFAGWRYGDGFGRRRRRNLMIAGGVAVVGVAAVAGGMTLGLTSGLLWQLPNAVMTYRQQSRVTVRVPRPGLPPIELSDSQAAMAKLVRRPDGDWIFRSRVLKPSTIAPRLRVAASQQQDFTGAEARQLLAGALVRVNFWGGSDRAIRAAVRVVEDQGSAQGVILGPGSPLGGSIGTREVSAISTPWRLAAEMALNEESERVALANELRVLEWQWQEADRLAKIADGLALPETADEELGTRRP